MKNNVVNQEVKRRRRRHLLDSVAGALLSALAAAGASIVANGHTWEGSVPLAFVAILLVISLIFGARAGILGTLLAAIIFATLLFKPFGKLQVANDVARANLAWMLLLGISLSFLFAPSTGGFRRH
jgi:K+-sensing histidine kinase KdpD